MVAGFGVGVVGFKTHMLVVGLVGPGENGVAGCFGTGVKGLTQAPKPASQASCLLLSVR